MRYAGIDKCEICNGLDVGASIYVQGCKLHCPGCFNPETWDFDGGKEWNSNAEKAFMSIIKKPYIKRVTIVGGEPLVEENLSGVHDLVQKIRTNFPEKTIWLYTGNTLQAEDFKDSDAYLDNCLKPSQIIKDCDYIVDGSFVESKKDLTLPFRGSSNQRIIDVKASKEKGDICML